MPSSTQSAQTHSHGDFTQILLEILLSDHASWLNFYVPNACLRPVLRTKGWGTNCGELLYLQVTVQTTQHVHLPPQHQHPSAPLTLIRSYMEEDDHAEGHCRGTEPSVSAFVSSLPSACKATFFNSVHGGPYEGTEGPVSQPVVQVYGLTLTEHQLVSSPHSRSSPCTISNEPARHSDHRIPKDLFPLIPRLQPSFNSCTSFSLTPLAHSQITSNSSPDLWSTDLGCSTPVWYCTCSDLFSVFSCFLTHFYP